MAGYKALQQKIMAAFTLPPKGSSIAAAVSGGCDSVAMLLLLREWCKIRRVSLCVFHVDHALRASSSEDCRRVEELATRLGLKFFWRRATESDLLQNRGDGVESWARRFRYSAFAAMQAESGADIIATGHTADDQAETIVMRMLRGCSLQGLRGIGSRSSMHAGDKVLKIWRPILTAARCDLEKYLNELGQQWLEDETNQTDLFFRNRIRHHVIPLLNEIQPGSLAHIIDLGNDIESVQAFLRLRAAKFLKKFRCDAVLEVGKIPVSCLRHEVLRQWLIELGLAEHSTRSLVGRIDDLWVKKINGRFVDHRKFRFTRRNGRIFFAAA